MNLAVRDIRYHRGRFLQTCIGLGLLIAVVMSMGGIYRGLVADATVALRATGADLWVVQQNTDGPFAASSRIPEDVKYRIAAVPGIEKASCLSYQNLQIYRFGKPLRFFLVGYEPGGLGGPPVIVTGRDLRQKHYEVVTDKSMGFSPGETIHLGEHDYTVVGITEKMASVTGDPYAYVTLADAQDIQFKDSNDAIRNNRARISARMSGVRTLSPAQGKMLTPMVSDIAGSTHIVNTVVARIAPGASLEEVQDRIRRWNHYRPISTPSRRKSLPRE